MDKEEYIEDGVRKVREFLKGIDSAGNEIEREGLAAIAHFANKISSELIKQMDDENIDFETLGRALFMISGMGGFLVDRLNDDMPPTVLLNMFTIAAEQLVTYGKAMRMISGLDVDG